MQTVQLQTSDAGDNAYGARKNAMFTNNEHKITYTNAQRVKAQRAIDVLQEGFTWEKQYTNYRKNSITLKFEGLRAKNAKRAEQVELALAERGYTKKVSVQGTIYALKRNLL